MVVPSDNNIPRLVLPKINEKVKSNDKNKTIKNEIMFIELLGFRK